MAQTVNNNNNRRSGNRPRYIKKRQRNIGAVLLHLITLAATLVSAALTLQLLVPVVRGSGFASTSGAVSSSGTAVMDRYDNYINNVLADTLEGLEGVERPKKTYFLSDEDLIAPEPNPACWGTTNDPSSLQWLLDAAAEELGVTDTIFSTETEIMPGSQVTYYLDDTILCITWKQVVSRSVFTMSEVKIAHASQFRRFLSDGTYGSDKQYYPSEMAVTVNAVTASSGDFYKFRSWGVNVYLGTVQNVNQNTKTQVDTCFIDENGDLIFSRAGGFTDESAAQAYVDENNIRFSLAFGPIMVEDGVNVVPGDAVLGEINKRYARMALCQVDELHYLMAASNQEGQYKGALTTSEFADQLISLGVQKAFALDGGQTAAIITNDTLINRPTYGYQRQISDIIYFATAIPDGE